MADNIAVTPGTGATIGADEVGGALIQRVKPTLGDDGTAVDWVGGAGTVGTNTARVTVATDDALHTILGAQADAASVSTSVKAALRGIATALGITAFDLGSGTGGSRTLRTILDTTQVPSTLDVQTTVTRPSNTTQYTANDAWANSTTVPTAGGFTFSNAAAASGGSGIITDAVIVSSAASTLQGEIWLFDQAVTAINDADPFLLSDADALFYLGKIAFTLAVEATNNSVAHVKNLDIGFHCVGTANLRYLIKVINAYTPASAETLTVRLKGYRT